MGVNLLTSRSKANLEAIHAMTEKMRKSLEEFKKQIQTLHNESSSTDTLTELVRASKHHA